MAEDRSDRFVAVVVVRVSLHEGVKPDDFETFMLRELFPSVDTSITTSSVPSTGATQGADPFGTVSPDQHVLLQRSEHFRTEYIWLSQLEYSVHHTPLPGWLSNRVERLRQTAQAKLAVFGSSSPPEVYYDVQRWRRKLGQD